MTKYLLKRHYNYVVISYLPDISRKLQKIEKNSNSSSLISAIQWCDKTDAYLLTSIHEISKLKLKKN